MSAKQMLRWGIIGTGVIANRFAKDLTQHAADLNVLTSVLSRSADRAADFGSRYNLAKKNCFTDFESFASKIDVCYVATPHTLHTIHAHQCLDHNLNVLVEKPFSLKSNDAEAVFKKAQEKNLFIMEAIWTRFIPAMRVAMDCVQSSGIGDVVGLDVDYGFDGHGAPPRLTDPLLGGGALYDVGTYGLHLATLFADHNPHPPIPEILHTKAKVRPDGVDETYNGILSYPSKTKGEELILNLRVSIIEDTSCAAFIQGKKGCIVLHPAFHHPETITINGKTQVLPNAGVGLHYQTREVYDCVQKGKIQSDVVPWSHTLSWSKTFEKLNKTRV